MNNCTHTSEHVHVCLDAEINLRTLAMAVHTMYEYVLILRTVLFRLED